MKITISSLDGLGDFILRLPMIRALLGDGHQIQLFLQKPAAELAEVVFPGVERHSIGANPYHPDTRRRKNPFRAEHAAIRKFGPALYVAGGFSINYFDQVWMECGDRQVQVAGFDTSDPFWPCMTTCNPRDLSQRFNIRAEVSVALPELEKNRLLASCILGQQLPLEPPRLEARPSDLESASALLSVRGLAPEGYWIACVGSRFGLRNKDWGEENWKKFFSFITRSDTRAVVFLGNPKEFESIERIRSALPASANSVNLAGEPPPIGVSLALVSLARGYLGRDSGVMHMAAATGRPVLAVYGGSHWGRFLPSSGPAVVVTCSVPCRGCDFSCPYEKPWCITDVRLETMNGAWNRLPFALGVEAIEQPGQSDRHLLSNLEARQHAHSAQIERQNHEQAERLKGLPSRMAGSIFSRLLRLKRQR
ncbi:MAG: glycosyltransferase family 9 protein [Verrucomicrobiota bacterium]